MAKIFSIFMHTKLINCPERWEHYKEIEDAPLLLMESEHKAPGELFFNFSGLRSTIIQNFGTEQYSLDEPMYINIKTKNNYYRFEVLNQWQ